MGRRTWVRVAEIVRAAEIAVAIVAAAGVRAAEAADVVAGATGVPVVVGAIAGAAGVRAAAVAAEGTKSFLQRIFTD
jgi:hypothetical protein